MSFRRRKKINPEVLIEALIQNAHATGNRPLEQRLADLTVWFYRNKHDIPFDNLAARQKHLEDSFWVMLEVFALLIERASEIEMDRKSKSLWLPKGMKVEGDLATLTD